jgi:hypothetical protein
LKQHFLNITASVADLGIILPLVLAMTIAAGMNTGLVLMGLGVYAIASGLIYRRPIPAQPMKVVAAMTIVGQMDQQAVMATGILIGITVLVLGLTGWAGQLKKLVSSTIMLGIQTALAFILLLTAVPFVKGTLLPALILLGLFILLKNTRAHPIAFITILAISLFMYWETAQTTTDAPLLELVVPVFSLPALDSMLTALNIAFFPQLALTLTNALFLTAVIAHEYFPDDKAQITEDRLAVSTGGLNLLLAPFGAIPMCHGASGLVAYHAAGGRSGLPVIVLGLVLLILGLMTGPAASYYLSLLPKPVFGILLLITATYMVAPKKLFKLSPVSMLTVLLVTVIGVVYSLLVGLLAGMLFEYISIRVIKLRKHADTQSP